MTAAALYKKQDSFSSQQYCRDEKLRHAPLVTQPVTNIPLKNKPDT